MTSWWYPGTVPPALPRPVLDPYAGQHNAELAMDPCARDHDFPRRSPRPEVVAQLRALIARAAAAPLVEVERDPFGKLPPPSMPLWAQPQEAA